MLSDARDGGSNRKVTRVTLVFPDSLLGTPVHKKDEREARILQGIPGEVTTALCSSVPPLSVRECRHCLLKVDPSIGEIISLPAPSLDCGRGHHDFSGVM